MRGPLGILFLTVFTAISGLSVLFPVLGPLGRELGLAEREIGLVSSGYALMQLLCAPLWGRMSERVGRKRVMAVGVVGFGVGFGLLGIAVELGRAGVLGHDALLAAMLAARVVGGALSSAMLPTAQAYAADVTPPERRTQGMAVLGGAFGLAVVLGPAIGAAVTRGFGLVAPIWASTGMAVLNLALLLTFLPEPVRVESSPRAPLPGSLARRAARLLVIGLVTTTATVLVEQTIAFTYEDVLGLRHEDTPTWVGAALVAYGVTAVFTQGWLVRRATLAPATLVAIGLPLTLASMVALAVADGFASLTLALVLQALGQGLVLPGVSAGLTLVAGDREQGPVAGLHNSAQGLGRFLGPLIGPTLYGLGRPLPYAASAVLLFVALVLVLLVPRVPAAAAAAAPVGPATRTG